MKKAPDDKRLAILTSGGDAPGMNAAIRAATLVGMAKGYQMIGVERGYRGLLNGEFRTLEPADVADILREGGTILGSARCAEFHELRARDQARARLAERGIDALIVIGGNGSLAGAHALADPAESSQPIRTIGVPASIDNDIGLTGLSIGVDTAMNTIVEACDKISDTATAHDRTFLIEVMGRDCGYLAMTSAIAAGADMVLFPEAERSEKDLVESIVNTILTVRGRSKGRRRVLAIKSEGVPTPIDRLKDLVDKRLNELLPNDPYMLETRVTVLGHVVRGGRPSAFDRLLGSRLANVAVRAAMNGDSRKMAAWMTPVEFPKEVGERSDADPYCWLLDLGAVMVETTRLLEGASPLARWRASVFDDLEDVFLL